jgi:hypothetical protein
VPRRNKSKNPFGLINERVVLNPLWLTVSEASKIMGANNKTVRRAIQDNLVKYKIVGERYFIETRSLLILIFSRTKLINKFNEIGLGQYVEKWRNEEALKKPKSPAEKLGEKILANNQISGVGQNSGAE